MCISPIIFVVGAKTLSSLTPIYGALIAITQKRFFQKTFFCDISKARYGYGSQKL